MLKIFLVFVLIFCPTLAYYNIYANEYNWKDGNWEPATWQPYVCRLEIIGGNTIPEDRVLEPMVGFRHCTNDVLLINRLWYSNEAFYSGHGLDGKPYLFAQVNLTPNMKHMADMLSFRITLNAQIHVVRQAIKSDVEPYELLPAGKEEKIRKEMEELTAKKQKELQEKMEELIRKNANQSLENETILKEKLEEMKKIEDSHLEKVEEKQELKGVYTFEDEDFNPVFRGKAPRLPEF